MIRHFVHALVVTLAVLVCSSISAGRAVAQTGAAGALAGQGMLADPFSFYYAIYLPNQQLQSMRPTPLDSVNDALVARQYYTQANRRTLYDPVSVHSDTNDPFRPYSNQEERLARPFRFSHDPSNSGGMGPSLYFNRISQYYPDLAGRTTRNQNANVYAGRSRRGGGRGGMGMGGMGMGGMGGGMGMGMGMGGGMF